MAWWQVSWAKLTSTTDISLRKYVFLSTMGYFNAEATAVLYFGCKQDDLVFL